MWSLSDSLLYCLCDQTVAEVSPDVSVPLEGRNTQSSYQETLAILQPMLRCLFKTHSRAAGIVWGFFHFLCLSAIWQEVPEQVKRHGAQTQICPFKQEKSKAMDSPQLLWVCWWPLACKHRSCISLQPHRLYHWSAAKQRGNVNMGWTHVVKMCCYWDYFEFKPTWKIEYYEKKTGGKNLIDFDSGKAIQYLIFCNHPCKRELYTHNSGELQLKDWSLLFSLIYRTHHSIR